MKRIARDFYGPFLMRTSVKVVVVMLFFVALAGSIYYSAKKVKFGLDVEEIFPDGTYEQNFVKYNHKYFSFVDTWTVVKDADYPSRYTQLLIRSLADTLYYNVSGVVLAPESGTPVFQHWLYYMKVWCEMVQAEFDDAWREGKFTIESKTRAKWPKSTSAFAVAAFKLLSHTRDGEINTGMVKRQRLVDDEGFINPSLFYHIITAWTKVDIVHYAVSQARFSPQPREWKDRSWNFDLSIPASDEIEFSQFMVWHQGLSTTDDFINYINQQRAIHDWYVDRGLPCYVRSFFILFNEQYINLPHHLLVSVGLILGGLFLMTTLLFFDIQLSILIVLVLAANVVELYAFMALIGITMSALPVVFLIISLGVGVEFTVHISQVFLTSGGSRSQRVVTALEHMMGPSIHGGISTLVSVLVLAFSEYKFVVKYIFCVVCAFIVLGLLNGLVVLPVLLSLAGPPSQMIHDGCSCSNGENSGKTDAKRCGERAVNKHGKVINRDKNGPTNSSTDTSKEFKRDECVVSSEGGRLTLTIDNIE